MQELGSLQLPPSSLWRLTAPKALTLALYAKKAGGGTIDLDYVELFPLDCYRNLKQLNYAVANGDQIFIDELQKPELAYGVDSGSKYYGTYIPRGSPLKLQPGTLQRIYFLFDEQSKAQVISRKHTVKVYIKHRRLSL
jgi:hypothetical protein